MSPPPAAAGLSSSTSSKRGRPRMPHTIVVSIRLSDTVYDAYCQSAQKANRNVRSILRHILTTYAPIADGGQPEIDYAVDFMKRAIKLLRK